VLLKRSRIGLAMRATSLDQETALAQGVNVGRMFSLAWAMSAALAALAGMLIGTGAGGVEATTALVALKALPVIIVGGIDSIQGSVIAGLFIGVAESLTRTYQPEYAPWLGCELRHHRPVPDPHRRPDGAALRPVRDPGGPARMSSTPRSLRRGRPELYSDYAADQAIWNTPAKRWSTVAVLLVALYLPFTLNRDLMGLATLVVVYAISGIGLNLVSGYAGQISLGHAVFMGLGAYTAALLGGSPSEHGARVELDLLIWLPMAGIVPASSAGCSPRSRRGSAGSTSRSSRSGCCSSGSTSSRRRAG
jgi:ABC-type branched-subunit amino acid transport system permease subunit